MKKFYTISGGTLVHVAPHFALCAPAYGSVGSLITDTLRRIRSQEKGDYLDYWFHDIKTKMAGGASGLETNEDLHKYIQGLIADPDTKCIIQPAMAVSTVDDRTVKPKIKHVPHKTTTANPFSKLVMLPPLS